MAITMHVTFLYNFKDFGSDNGLSPGQRQAIIWTNAGILLIGPLEAIVSEISINYCLILILENAFHDDVIKWKHYPRYWPVVRGIHRSQVNSPHKGQWRGALIFTLICARINGLVNNREAGDLRRHRAHYDVIVMWKCYLENGTHLVSASMC